MPKRKPTWLEIAVHNGGFRKATKALVWAHQWAVVREALGHDPSVDEVAEWWKAPRRTAFREQAAFRDCFPTLDSPAPLYENPVALAGARLGAALGDEIDPPKPEARPDDEAILEVGMGEATI